MNIAIIIPCLNEESTISKLIENFKLAIPDADIYVGDNNCTDRTAEIAANANAIVIKETEQGKGAMFKTMLQQVSADIYILVDGDGTYLPQDSTQAISLLKEKSLDCVLINRPKSNFLKPKLILRLIGNYFFYTLFRLCLDIKLHDPLTGYRVFTQDFITSFPFKSTNYTLEAELNFHLSQNNYQFTQIDCSYQERPTGSHSSLNIWGDGFKILVFTIQKYLKLL